MAQSVRDRLLNRMRETGEEYQVLLTRFALERLLYRLTRLPEGDDFVLKGAFTFLIWDGHLGRQTRDLDLLGSGAPDTGRLREIFRRACQADVPDDGVRFDSDSLEVAPIREGAEYEGLRVKLYAHIGSARLRLQVDVGFGDATVPSPEHSVFPGLLDFPEPEIKSYRPETVVAEKLHGMVQYGRANTRMKDFYDIWQISREAEIDRSALVSAIRATFRRRETALPEGMPVALTETFLEESGKERQWEAFLRQVKGGKEDQKADLRAVIADLRDFLLPVLRAVGEDGVPPGRWAEGGPWRVD
jgi:predicted nucleotidyltransferase component of viral defense system